MRPEELVWGFLPGREIPKWLAQALEKGDLAGVVLFSRNLGTADEIRELTSELQKRWKGPHPLPIAVDQEGGRVRRLKFIPWPSAHAVASVGDTDLTARVGRLMGQELASLGFNVDFAPVLDLSHPDAPGVIGDRSFGPDPATVISHASAWIMGLRSAGVSACGKHFPGHGAAVTDSHMELPMVQAEPGQLGEHRQPFEALAPYLDLVMTAHVLYTGLDEVPVTFSRKILETFRYDGILITDDLEMGALGSVPPRERGVRAIEAGHHSLLVCSSEEIREETVAGLYDAWKDLEPLVAQIAVRLDRWHRRMVEIPRIPLGEIHSQALSLLESMNLV